MNDTVTMRLCKPRGWIYVDELEHDRWGWEARIGGWHLDAGIEPTKQDALNKAQAIVDDYNRERA
jgi:hypothetical protein